MNTNAKESTVFSFENRDNLNNMSYYYLLCTFETFGMSKFIYNSQIFMVTIDLVD